MTAQDEASYKLARWQELKAQGLSPRERLVVLEATEELEYYDAMMAVIQRVMADD
jgi:hypothetical protein